MSALPSLPAARGFDVALGWHVGYQTSDRVAVLLGASASVYQYSGEGRRRKRSFESITPMVEYRLSDEVRVAAGAGLQLDAPAFYDMQVSRSDERRFSRGVGAVLSASYALPRRTGFAPELRARWSGGFADVPQGRLRGQSTALLMGMRRDPMP